MQKAKTRGQALQERVSALRAEHGDKIKVDDVASLVESMMTTLEGDISSVDIQVHRELKELAAYIQDARSEIARIRAKDIPAVDIPTATDELDAVVEATAEATNAILDAAEQLAGLTANLPPDVAKTIESITTKIYEASNFQDITGQRITKVVRTLRHIEQKICELTATLGDDSIKEEKLPAPPPVSDNSESSLLNGPQLPGNANSQADIDALLASFE